MLRIFSKDRLSKDLCSKVYKACGINISEDDTRSAVGWRYFRRQNGSLYSESSICRQYAV